METEKALVQYICEFGFEDLPQESREIVKKMVIGVLGTAIAGAESEGISQLRDYYNGLGGKAESTVFISGEKLPAENTGFLNSTMARALDFDDAMAPGMHIGASAVPTALAVSELVGGCSGKDLLTAVALGSEIAARLNLSEAAYDGFDPTGVCTVFASTVIASKILGLSESQAWNGLGLAFNKCAGSFQSNIDGALAVRIIQGGATQSGITCARLAQAGLTGPKNFLEGVYGYFHLYGKDMFKPYSVLEGLGETFELQKILFKKYPSCGLTLGSTEAVLGILRDHDISPPDIKEIEIRVPPYAHKLVGHPFELGENPRVNAQFNIHYCVANALLRKNSKLDHFEEPNVKDPKIGEMVKKISVHPAPELEKRGHTALDMRVFMTSGDELVKEIDIAPGFPGNPLRAEDHENHFKDCSEFSKRPASKERIQGILDTVNGVEKLEDANALIPLVLF